jgi:hypothetical protein
VRIASGIGSHSSAWKQERYSHAIIFQPGIDFAQLTRACNRLSHLAQRGYALHVSKFIAGCFGVV